MKLPNMGTLQRISEETGCICKFTSLMRILRYGAPLVHFDPVAEAKLRLKIDLYIVPTVSLLYLFCFIDRANIGKCSPHTE
jgi:hypothetical protein